MAKLLLIQTLFLTIRLFTFVSGKIQNKNELQKKVIANEVEPIYSELRHAQYVKGPRARAQQFAVLMLSDTDKDWNTFKLSLKPSSKDTSMVQPAADKIDN